MHGLPPFQYVIFDSQNKWQSIFSGQAINDSTNSQDAWLLKVDSVGCPYPNCTVGINELEPTEVVVDVWPNPTTNFLNIEAASGTGELDIRVTDMVGNQVYRSKLVEPTNRIDVSAWPKGLYVVHGQDEQGRKFSLKFVKE